MRYILLITADPLSPETTGQVVDGVRFDDMGPDVSEWADEPEKLARLESLGDNRRVYAVHWNDLDALKALLIKIADSDNVIVDDDHQLFLTGSEFAAMCKTLAGNRWWLGGSYR